MNDSITLTFSDIRNIVLQAHRAGRNGEFVYGVAISKSRTASQPLDAMIGMEVAPLSSGSANEPVPYVTII